MCDLHLSHNLDEYHGSNMAKSPHSRSQQRQLVVDKTKAVPIEDSSPRLIHQELATAHGHAADPGQGNQFVVTQGPSSATPIIPDLWAWSPLDKHFRQEAQAGWVG